VHATPTAGGSAAMQVATRAAVDESAAVQQVQTRTQHAQAEASTSHVTDAKATTDSPWNPAWATTGAGGLQSADRRPKCHAVALHSSLESAKDWTVEFLAAVQSEDEAIVQLKKNGCKIR
jgi:glycine cleavage system pyridoxal-binding protein P